MIVVLYTCYVCQKCSTKVVGFLRTSVLQSQTRITCIAANQRQSEKLMMCLGAEGSVCGKCALSGNSEYLCVVLCCIARGELYPENSSKIIEIGL